MKLMNVKVSLIEHSISNRRDKLHKLRKKKKLRKIRKKKKFRVKSSRRNKKSSHWRLNKNCSYWMGDKILASLGEPISQLAAASPVCL